MKYIALSLVSLCAFSSCASIVSKSEYPVAFKSDGSPVQFKVSKPSGEIVHSGVTPATVTLAASEGYFRAASYNVKTTRGSVAVNASMDPWYTGNIVFGGLIGAVGVDPVTGSMWKLPKEVNLSEAKKIEQDASSDR